MCIHTARRKFGGIIINNFLSGLDWSYLTNKLIIIIPALLCITFHELSHGFVAYKLGDNTAKDEGRLTLNPIKHIDIIGLIMMIFAGFGWAKPVPVNMNNFKNPKMGMAVTALAGPVSNLLLSAFVLFFYGLAAGSVGNAAALGNVWLQMLFTTAYLSCMLAVFNLLPIPPLDGSKILFSLLPERQYYKLMQYERFGMIILLVIILTGSLSTYLSTGVGWVFDRLFVIAQWSAGLLS